MDQPAVDSHEASPESLHALGGECVDRSRRIENYAVYFSIEFWVLRRLGIQPLSWPGRLVGGIVHFLMVLLPALILTAMTGQWDAALLLSWTVVAVGFGGAASIASPLYRSVLSNFLFWVWAVVDTADLRRFAAWMRRWYSHRVIAPVSGALTLGTVLPVYFFVLHGSGVPLPAGTLYICGFLLFVLAQATCILGLVVPQGNACLLAGLSCTV